jgi:hypothetical protein
MVVINPKFAPMPFLVKPTNSSAKIALHIVGGQGEKIFRAGGSQGSSVDPNKLHPFQIPKILGIPLGMPWRNGIRTYYIS